MLHKLNYFIYKHELKIGILGFIFSFLYYLYFPGTLNFLRTIPLITSWISVFFIGDAINKNLGETSIFPHRKDQFKKLERLGLAALIMNMISDMTGAWLLKLWYYPAMPNPILYLILAPIGYIIFGLILYVFYKLFKNHYDRNVLRGRLKKKKKNTYIATMYLELITGLIGMCMSSYYIYIFSIENNIIWYKVNQFVKAEVNLVMPIILWISIFFLLEFICFKLNRETLTRDLVRGNFLPLISIFMASVICIILVELFNAPFQIWSFTNWPYTHINLFNIPGIAYLLWPLQYLLLLPIIRILDGKNEENIW